MILWKNGILHSLENESKIYHQMVTDQGVIIGFDDEVKDLNVSRIIDLEGAHLYPGFVDAHIHLMGYGQKLSRPSLKGICQKEDILKIINKHQAQHIFEGYEGDILTLSDLDIDDRVIVLRHKDYHSATVNQKALDLMNVHSHHGVLTEDDAQKAMILFGKATNKQLTSMFEKALKSLYQFGVTGGHSDDLAYFNGFQNTLNAMDNVLHNMPFRTHLLMHYDILDDYLSSNRPFLDQHDYLQLGAIKIFYDGTFSSKTALVSAPYVDGSMGLHIFEKKTLEKLLAKIRWHKLPVAVHVIGDVGLSELLDLLKRYPAPKGIHDRIIHASMWQSKDLKKAKELPLIFDIQPQFVSSDIPEVLHVFKSKPKTLYPWRTLWDNGLMLCGGSDAPVEIPNPILGMYDAIYRETDIGVYDQRECLSRYEALKLYTINAAVPSYHQHSGYLKKGYIADFTILEKDVLTIDKNEFKDNKVKMTVINEQIVYKA